MPRYVVRKPAISAREAIKAVKQNNPTGRNFKATVDKKRRVRHGKLYRVSFTKDKRRKK